MLAVLATLPCAAQLKRSDSTTVSNEALRRVYTAALQKKNLDSQVVILNQRIEGLELVIKEYQDMDTATRASYERQIVVLGEERKILEAEISRLNKDVRKWKRKLFWRTAGGAVVIIGLTTLLIIK